MLSNDFRLIVVSPEVPIQDELKTATELLRTGQVIYHLRKSNWTREQFDQWLSHVPKAHLKHVTIHQHVELANEWKLGGVHFKSNQIVEAFNGRISKSVHDLSELETVSDFPLDYIFYSPVFESISKPGYKSDLPIEKIAQLIGSVKIPVVGLGGIQKSNLLQLKDHGFSGAAFMGGFWMIDGVQHRLKYFRDSLKLVA